MSSQFWTGTVSDTTFSMSSYLHLLTVSHFCLVSDPFLLGTSFSLVQLISAVTEAGLRSQTFLFQSKHSRLLFS